MTRRRLGKCALDTQLLILQHAKKKTCTVDSLVERFGHIANEFEKVCSLLDIMGNMRRYGTLCWMHAEFVQIRLLA